MTWELFEPWRTLTIVSVMVVVIQLLAIASIFHSLRYVRSSQAAVAWAVGLLTLPFLALPLYWVFARNRFEGYREAIRDVGRRHLHSVTAIRRELSTGNFVRSTSLTSPLEQVADVLDTPISDGNQFRLLIDGQQFFDSLFDMVAAAQSYVYASFFIIRDDELGRRFADTLIERARAGVTVRLLYDEVGCLRLPGGYISRLMEAGIDVRPFATRQGWFNRFQINFRNHRKLVVVDGKRALIGGLNVADEYVGKVSWVSHWRDTGVEVVGQATRKIQAVFAGDYYWAARHDLPEAVWVEPAAAASVVDESTQTDPTGVPEVGHGLAAICATGPADQRPRATMMFAAAALAAKQRLWISSPYLVPDDSSFVALHMAKARGVDVRLLIPAHADHWGVYLAGFHYEREFTDAEIPVYRYNAGFLHQKCVLVDDSLVLIGSTNLDNRSLHLNFELMIAVEDQSLIAEAAAMLEKDFADATPSKVMATPTRRWFARLGTAVARLFSPVL